ncbi:MAG: ATP synthase subunit I [Peptostreptococcaceae bacterium]|nr:ATP synthase subunit I [Peptostreptococcaceae bacterium]
MSYTSDIQATTIKWTLTAIAIMGGISIFFLKEPLAFALGLVFGGLIGILNFVDLARTLERAVRMRMDKAKTFTALKYFIRYITMIIVLFVSIKADYINVIGTIIGLLLIKFVVLATNLFNNRDSQQKYTNRKGDE